MKADKLLLRCYAEQVGDQWQAFCLDFDLAAQGDGFNDARERLDCMIVEYVYDALAGEDREYAEQLLSRRAPMHMWAKYYLYSFAFRVLHIRNSIHRMFKTPVPLAPANHCHA